MNNQYCTHDWKDKDTKIVCKLCGASRLRLEKTEKDGLRIGVKKDGKKYSVRDNRKRYFFPDEWIKFYDSLRANNKIIFDILINTGARIDEALNIKAEDVVCEGPRKTITLKVTKIKARKGDRVGERRTFAISSQFARRISKHIRDNKIKDNEALVKATSGGVWKLLRRKLQSNGVKDWYNFSLHNIRKTHGMYLVALGVKDGEIIHRLGHDYNTFYKHYGSPNIFTRHDNQLMLKILGDVYDLK